MEKTITLRLRGGNWEAMADFTEYEWIETPFYGPSIIGTAITELKQLNPGYSITVLGFKDKQC